jgi:hypothetical protein
MSATKEKAAAPGPTTTTAKGPAPEPAPAAPAARSRKRTGLKRLKFRVPRAMPWPVRSLWEGASEEEKARAHRTATAILSTWLGKSSREEAAKALSLSGVRFWQLSQQAVCGLVVGCLRQPRHRGRAPRTAFGAAEEGLGALRRRIAGLERELDGSRRLIEVLKDLPGNRERAATAEATAGHGRGESGGRRGRGAGEDDGGAARAGGPAAGGGEGP